MTVAEYLSELIGEMHAIVAATEELARDQTDMDVLNDIGREAMRRWEAMLTRLQPPPEMEALHERLWEVATGPADDQGFADVYLELARQADENGLELIPGVSLEQLESEALNAHPPDFAIEVDLTAESDWEQKLRRALEEAGHADIDSVIEQVRKMRDG